MPKGLRGFQKGKLNPNYGKKLTDSEKDILSKIGKERVNNGTWSNQFGKYKGGIKWRDLHSLNNPEYKEWRLSVLKRDNYKCKIDNCDCSKKLQVHHILSWRDYPELRYNINNGITLCQFHHPRGVKEEKRLIPFLQGLVEAIRT